MWHMNLWVVRVRVQLAKQKGGALVATRQQRFVFELQQGGRTVLLNGSKKADTCT